MGAVLYFYVKSQHHSLRHLEEKLSAEGKAIIKKLMEMRLKIVPTSKLVEVDH